MLNSIDLLIVDEAGQAVPAVASAAVALSKKALIVGDTDQIEPVWNTTEGVDKANLRSHGLLTDDLQYAEEWDYLSLTASSGNLMRVAQRQTPFHQIAGLSKGLYLTEHRRCYDEIVGYCNKLIYEGVLEPKRGAWEPHALPPLSLIHTGHPSKQVGQSRGNPQEAKDIARWLAEHQEQLIADAKKETLKESVAVITPFKQQTYMIEKEAKALGLPRITIGTIHSLQGGERPIVLFSSVYGPDDHGSRFYDSQPNMLNVAVSRAKNAFIVFGCRESFGRQNPTAPSGVLRDFIDAIAMDPSYPSIDTPVTLEKG